MRRAGRRWIVVFSLLTIATRTAPVPGADPGEWKEVRTFVSTTGNVTAVALAPDGDRIAVCATMYGDGGGEQHLVMLCGVTANEEFSKLGSHDGEIGAAAFLPDGAMLATTGRNQTVKLWDVNLRTEIQSWPIGGRGFGVAFTPDGKHLIAAGTSLWIQSIPDLKHVLRIDNLLVSSVAVSPDSTLIATGEQFPQNSHSYHIRLRSLATGEVLHSFDEAHKSVIWLLAFSSDGQRLVSGSWDGTARIWDIESGKLSATLSPNIGTLFSVAYSPDGSLVSLGNWDHPLQLWSSETGEIKYTLSGGRGRCAAFSSDGGTLVTNGAPKLAPDRAPLAEVKVWRFVD